MSRYDDMLSTLLASEYAAVVPYVEPYFCHCLGHSLEWITVYLASFNLSPKKIVIIVYIPALFETFVGNCRNMIR